MKNTKHKICGGVVVTLLLFSFTSCGEGEKKGNDPQKINTSNVTVEVEAPDNIISLAQADSIYDNYSKHRVAVIETYEAQERAPEEKFEAARFVDFDYQMLKDYIAYVDQESKKAGVTEVTKMRLYFANYPNKNNFPNGKKVVHKRQNSIFMLPTLEKNGLDYGYYIGADGKAQLIADWKAQLEKGMGLNGEKSNKFYAGFGIFNANNAPLYNGGSLTLNFGGSGPPPKTDF